jgi:membrane protein YqaA with SNARE-associated domain
MSAVATAAGGLVFGFGSAIVPVLNAEGYAVIASARGDVITAAFIALALGVGQTVGKLLLFETARRGSARLAALMRRDRHTPGRWSARVRRLLGERRTGVPLVLLSSTVGLPPLAVVALAAGASPQRRWEFGAACLIGRLARFSALAIPAAMALS